MHACNLRVHQSITSGRMREGIATPNGLTRSPYNASAGAGHQVKPYTDYCVALAVQSRKSRIHKPKKSSVRSRIFTANLSIIVPWRLL